MAHGKFHVQRREPQKRSSPEELRDDIKLSTPGVWLVIAAAAALLGGLLIWAAFGRLDSSLSLRGLGKDGAVRCYAAEVSEIQPGCRVTVGELVARQQLERDE